MTGKLHRGALAKVRGAAGIVYEGTAESDRDSMISEFFLGKQHHQQE